MALKLDIPFAAVALALFTDLVPITQIAYAPQILVVSPLVKATSVNKQLSAEGGEPVANARDEFAKWLKAEIAKWGTVVKAANIRPE
jgi:tripartite-type tricarboxylate transporter receptor subunit TctC